MKWQNRLIAAIAIIFLMVFPIKASAHAYIVKASPSQDEVMKHPPKQVSIQFDEEIQKAFHSLKVLDQSGKRVDRNDAHIDQQNQTILKASVKPNLPNGTYTIQWSIISSDGHPVKGTIPFQIGENAGANQQVSGSTAGYIPGPGMVFIRWLFYLSSAVYAGILFFTLFLTEKSGVPVLNRHRKLLRVSIAGLAVSILLSLPLQVIIDTGAGWKQSLHWNSIQQIMTETTFGSIWMIQIAVLIVLYVLTYFYLHKERKKVWASAGLLGFLSMIFSKAFMGHSAAAELKSLAIAMDFLHMAAAALWIGSLVSIAILFRKKNEQNEALLYRNAIHRFSLWGFGFVGIILLSGIYESFQFIPTVQALFHTAYGKVLMGKIILLCVMIAFAAFHFIRGKQKKRLHSSSIWIEFLAGAAVLVLAAILTNLPTAMAAPGKAVQEADTKNGYSVSLQITPNVIGKNNFNVSITRSGKKVKNLEQITITLTSLDMDMGETTIEIPKSEIENEKPVKGVISMSGRWRVHVHGLTKSLNDIDASFNIVTGSE